MVLRAGRAAGAGGRTQRRVAGGPGAGDRVAGRRVDRAAGAAGGRDRRGVRRHLLGGGVGAEPAGAAVTAPRDPGRRRGGRGAGRLAGGRAADATATFEPFLFLLGSVFVPLFGVFVADYFLTPRSACRRNRFGRSARGRRGWRVPRVPVGVPTGPAGWQSAMQTLFHGWLGLPVPARRVRRRRERPQLRDGARRVLGAARGRAGGSGLHDDERRRPCRERGGTCRRTGRCRVGGRRRWARSAMVCPGGVSRSICEPVTVRLCSDGPAFVDSQALVRADHDLGRRELEVGFADRREVARTAGRERDSSWDSDWTLTRTDGRRRRRGGRGGDGLDEPPGAGRQQREGRDQGAHRGAPRRPHSVAPRVAGGGAATTISTSGSVDAFVTVTSEPAGNQHRAPLLELAAASDPPRTRPRPPRR